MAKFYKLACQSDQNNFCYSNKDKQKANKAV